MNFNYLYPVLLFFITLPIYYRISARWQNIFILTFSLGILLLANSTTTFFAITQSLFLLLCLYFFQQSKSDHKKRWLYFFLTIQTFLWIVFVFFYKTVVGISFLSFMLIGLALDYLWNRTDKKISLPLMTSLVFGPILLMGPIEKISTFVKQFETKRLFHREPFQEAIYLILFGLFKVLCVANSFKEFTHHQEVLSQNVYGLWLFSYGTLAYLKLYCEFSGFIDMVTGISLLWGFKLSLNFNRPYLSQNPIEIWKRWHITLTLWLQNYIYLPLLLKTKKHIWPVASICLITFIWHGSTSDYFYWILFWLIIILIYVFLKKISHNFWQTARWFNILIMNIILSLSAFCFMWPHYGVNILSRLMTWSDPEKEYIIKQQLSGNTWVFNGLFCFLIVLILELRSEKLKVYQKYLWPILMILIISMARLDGTFFFYLGL